MKNSLTLAAFILASAFAPAAMAVSTFNLSDRSDPGACTQNASNAGNFGNSWTCSQVGGTGDEMVARAYGTSGGGGAFATAYLSDQGSSGFGVANQNEGIGIGSPNHSMDNGGTLDSMLFSFNSSIALTSMKLGWSETDSDMTVLAWTGAGDPIAALTGSNTSTLLSSGWSLIGSYGNVSTSSDTSINAGMISSSYWLIAAYNSTLGAKSGLDNGNDYVKLKYISGTFTCPPGTPGCGGGGVSEPASLALVGMGLLGAVGVRRRRGAKVA